MVLVLLVVGTIPTYGLVQLVVLMLTIGVYVGIILHFISIAVVKQGDSLLGVLKTKNYPFFRFV